MIGQSIESRYDIEALIGRGGMGSVYRALDRVENRPVAIKVLHTELSSGPAPSRFYREFRVLTRIEHPNIVRAYAYGAWDGSPYLVLELLQGRTLQAELAYGALPRGYLLHIARQLCDALAYLHAQSIIHRDLKPGNLMLLASGEPASTDLPQVKLMDFGLARLNEFTVQLTQDGSTLGTVAYMAPEQAQGLPLDFRADLYALGVILYEMATGRPPFVHENPATVLLQQITTPPPPPRHFNPDLDEALSQLILCLLAKDPAQRPASTRLLGAQLAQLLDESAAVLSLPPEAAAAVARSPLIGREAPLAELARGWADAQAGQGQLVLVAGVAGVGKTRLLNEARLRAFIGKDRFLLGRCREQAAMPYQPFMDILDGLLPGLPPAARAAIPPELACLLPSVSVGEAPLASDPAEARLRLFAAYGEVLRQVAAAGGLMLAIEDVQWADAASLELLDYLAQRLEQARVVLILTYRPEEVEPDSALERLLRDWRRGQAGRPPAHALTLALLDRQQVASFLHVTLGWESVPDWLVESFHVATDGNPLFIEETLKVLADEGEVATWRQRESSHWTASSQVGRTLQLPQSVLGLAERRLRNLPDDERSVLTAAAVMGPEFTFDVLQQVTQLDEDSLIDIVDHLLAARLIEELPLQNGQDRYRFAQEPLRQALLSTISQRRLRLLHRRSGEAIEALYDTSLPRYWPALAYHFAEAQDEARALKYFTLAGDAAAQVYANLEAVEHYTQALALAKAGGANDLQWMHLYIQRGRSLDLNRQYDEALRNYEEMERVALERDNRALQLAAMMARATLYATPTPVHNLKHGRVLSEQALALARELGDRRAEAKALWNLLLVSRMANLPDAITYGEQSLAIARALNLREQLAFTLNDIQLAYLSSGQVARARAALFEAQQLWRELGNMPMLADNLGSLAINYSMTSEYERALQVAGEGQRISQSIGNLWGQAHNLWAPSFVYIEYGQPDQALEALETSLDLVERGAPVYVRLNAHAQLAWLYGLLGAVERGLDLAQRADIESEKSYVAFRWQAKATLTRLYVLKGDLAAAGATLASVRASYNSDRFSGIGSLLTPLVAAELAIARGDYATAIADMTRYVEVLRANPEGAQESVFRTPYVVSNALSAYLAEGLHLKGLALLAQARLDEAGAALLEVCDIAAGIGSRRLHWPALAALAQLEAQRGNAAQAEHLRQQARQIVDYIVAHTSRPDLRASFLALPHVQALLT